VRLRVARAALNKEGTMSTVKIKVGPEDNGRRMSLADFEFAEVKEGYRYELARGVLVVSEVPNPPHLAQVLAIRRQLVAYELAHPGRIYGVLAASECKLLVQDFESERHPDLAVYKTPPPSARSTAWRTWGWASRSTGSSTPRPRR
jgi:hypothetical protein